MIAKNSLICRFGSYVEPEVIKNNESLTSKIVLSFIAVSSGILMVLVINYPTPKRGQKADLSLIGVAGVAVICYLIFPGILLLSIILFISLFYTIVGPLYLKYTSRSE